ncbi:MAG: hypothetical protein AB7G06_02505 [Bdellovibrionales bacterium]
MTTGDKPEFHVDGVHLTQRTDETWLADGVPLNDRSASGIAILFPNYNALHLLTKLALQAMPQTADLPWLAGKGWGCELAIQGTVEGRLRYPLQLPLRAHSDMELYNTPQGFNYSPAWPFGAQEYFGQRETKLLAKAGKPRVLFPEGFLTATAETVDFEGIKINVPRLEILCVDKFLGPGAVGRDIGGEIYTDAEVLIACYDLDKGEMQQLLDDYYILPNIAALETGVEANLISHFAALSRYLLQADDLQQATAYLNQLVEATDGAGYGKIDGVYYEPLTAGAFTIQADEDGKPAVTFSDDYLQKTKSHASDATQKAIAGFVAERQKLSQSFERGEALRSKLMRPDMRYTRESVTTARLKRPAQS